MADGTFNLNIELGTDKALRGLKNLQKEFDSTEKKASRVGTGGQAGINSLTKSVQGLTGAFSGLGAVVGAISFASIVQGTIRTIAGFETLQTTLTTITGSAQGAAQALALIKDVSAVTSFSTEQLGESFIKLQAAGITPTKELLTLFSDVASVTTDKIGALQAITDLYARTTAGGLGLEELNRLADRGIPVFDILGKRLGASRLQLSELGKTAEGAQIILRSLEAGLSTQVGGSSAASLNTLNGQFETLTKNLKGLALTAGSSGLTAGLKDLLSVLNEVVTSSDGTAQSVGKILGDALRGVAIAIKFVTDNFWTFVNVVGIVVAVFAPMIGGLRLLITYGATLTKGLGPLRSAWVLVSEVMVNLFQIWARNPFKAAIEGIKNIGVEIGKLIAQYPKLAALLGAVTGLAVIGEKEEKPAGYNFPDTAGAGRGDGQIQLEYERKRLQEQADADRKRAQELLTGRDQIISKIVAGLRQEASLIGLSSQKAEEQNKIYEAQAQIRDKLITAGKTEAEANKEAARLVNERAGEIRAAVAAKYSAELKNQMKIMKENNAFEISVLGLSTNELEKQTKLRQILVELGIKDTATEKQKAEILKEITKLQDAQISLKLSDAVRGITAETDALRLNNTEREKRAALDAAAKDAGFSGRADLLLNRPADYFKISSAIDQRNQEQINVGGEKEIEGLREQLSLLRIIDEKERERVENRLAIYRAIDPDGKGKNITEAQKAEIEVLNKQIEAQKELIRINEQINDSFKTLGDAVTQWALGTEGGIRRVKLELIKLAALEIWKRNFQGASTGANAFFGGLVSGLGGRAAGGPVLAGRAYRVGEQGPETLLMGQNGFVIPNQQATMESSGNRQVSLVLNPKFENHGTINSAEDLDSMFAAWTEQIAVSTQKLVRDQFSPTGLAYR